MARKLPVLPPRASRRRSGAAAATLSPATGNPLKPSVSGKPGKPLNPAAKKPVDQEAMRSLLMEVSVNRRRFLGLQPERLYNPDELVGRRGLDVYSKMMTDDSVRAAMTLKQHAVLSTGWDIEPATDAPQDIEAAEFCQAAFEFMEGTLDDDLIEIMCLHGDTVIHSPEGDRPIRELVGRRPLVYSVVNNRMVLAQASKVVLSGQAVPCVKVSYAWKSGWGRSLRRKRGSIICTDTHPFLLRDGVTYRKAGDLRAGDRLLPFDVSWKRGGYRMIKPPFEPLQKRARWVWEQVHGVPVPAHMAVHHVDGDRQYDAPENLVLKTLSAHMSDHNQSRIAKMSAGERRRWIAPMIQAHRTAMRDPAKVRQLSAALRQTLARPEMKAQRAAQGRKLWTDPNIVARCRAGMRAAWTPERRAKLAEANRCRVWTPAMRAKKGASQRAACAAKRRLENHEVLSVEPWGLADVYDMQVPGTGNFAANCVWVHNSSLSYGFSLSELVFAPMTVGRFAGKIGIKAIKTRMPHDFLFVVDQHDNLLADGIEQYGVRLPTWKFAIHSANKQFDNWYGRSDLQAAYRPYWFKDNVLKWWSMFLDRYGIPLAEGVVQRTVGLSDAAVTDLRVILDNLQAATSIVHPPDVELKFPTAGTAQGSQIFVAALESADKAIARALLMPNLLGVSEQGGVGSYSQARKQFDVFILVVEKLQRELSETVMGEQVIKRLIDLNYTVEDYPNFVFLPFTETNKSQLLEIWFQAVAAGVVKARPEDEAHVRLQTEFPQISMEELQAEAALDAQRAAAIAGAPTDGNLPPGQEPSAGQDGQGGQDVTNQRHRLTGRAVDALQQRMRTAGGGAAGYGLGEGDLRLLAQGTADGLGKDDVAQQMSDALEAAEEAHPDWGDAQLIRAAVDAVAGTSDAAGELSDEDIQRLIDEVMGGGGTPDAPKALSLDDEAVVVGPPTRRERAAVGRFSIL